VTVGVDLGYLKTILSHATVVLSSWHLSNLAAALRDVCWRRKADVVPSPLNVPK
jgi:hypothetical protein